MAGFWGSQCQDWGGHNGRISDTIFAKSSIWQKGICPNAPQCSNSLHTAEFMTQWPHWFLPLAPGTTRRRSCASGARVLSGGPGTHWGWPAEVGAHHLKCTSLDLAAPLFLAPGSVLDRSLKKHSTCGLVAMTSASHAEGRQFDPGLV